MNTTVASYGLKEENKKYDISRNKMFVQPKPHDLNNKITYRPSHPTSNYSPAINPPTNRNQYNSPITNNPSIRIYNGQSIPQSHFNTQPINGPRIYQNGTSASGSRGSLSGRVNTVPSERNGQAFGKYKLIREIGKGNFAKVKLAQHLVTGKEVAVKIIDKTKLNSSALQKPELFWNFKSRRSTNLKDPGELIFSLVQNTCLFLAGDLDQFQLTREVKVMKELNHPNVVRLYEVIQTERSLYLVMEYAQNGEVFEYLVKNGRMKEKDARAKFRQIVSAVQYCHQKMIVHRDLKAENLLLDKDFSIKIADFGFSNYFSRQSKLNTFCGSPPYAAPELFQGRKYEGPEVDVWSLGVILYTLISGSLPFDGGTLRELRERVLRGKYRIPFYMSSECETLLKKMLVLNPLKRLPLNEIMKDPWINIGYDDCPLRPYFEPEVDYNDKSKIDVLLTMGFSLQQIAESLQQKRYDGITAIYLLWKTGISKPSTKITNAPLVPNYMNSRPKINYSQVSTTSSPPKTITEISPISKAPYVQETPRNVVPHIRSQSTRFYRKPTNHTKTITTSIDNEPLIDKQPSSSSSSTSSSTNAPATYDFTQTKFQNYHKDSEEKKSKMQTQRDVVSPFSDVTIKDLSNEENLDDGSFDSNIDEFENSEKESLHSNDVKNTENSSFVQDNDDSCSDSDICLSTKMLETNIDDDADISHNSEKSNAKVKRNQTFNNYPISINSPARKGYNEQNPFNYALFLNHFTDHSKLNEGFNNSPLNVGSNKTPLLNLNSGNYESDQTPKEQFNSKLQRSKTSNIRSVTNANKPMGITEHMDKLVEEPDNQNDNETPREPIHFHRATKGYQSLRLPDMIPPYQAFTSSGYNNKPHQKKDDSVPSSGLSTNREQSPFSRNTPERATIQHVPQNKRERIQLEKQVMSGVGGPSGPSNLPIAIGGSINHPQPPVKDDHLKKSSDECVTEQNSTTTAKSKKKLVNSFFKSLTTKISKRQTCQVDDVDIRPNLWMRHATTHEKLSNLSPNINRSPSNQDSTYAGQGSIQRTHANQNRYIDTKEWSNNTNEPPPMQSPYFPDRPGRYVISKKASNFDTENLINSSCATSLASSGSSLANPNTIKVHTKPRNFRFSFRTKVTSKKCPDELMTEIKRVLITFHIDYEQQTNFLLFCTYGESSGEAVIQWEIEVVRLNSKSMNGIRFKRLFGPQIKFKEISKRVIERLQL